MKGSLLIAGGNIGATAEGKRAIFGRFAQLAGGARGTVLVAVCASGEPQESYELNSTDLREAGVGKTVLLPLTGQPEYLQKPGWTDRADETLLPLLEGVTGIWFTGGDQLRTVRLLLQPDGSDTPLLSAMRRVLERGGVIGGSSAGAAIMSHTMIVRGDDLGALTLPVQTELSEDPEREESPEALVLTRGLGFLPRGIVDQHFNRRARLQRLLKAMEAAGEEIGYGISEDTAMEVRLETESLCVHGSAYVLQVHREKDRTILQTFTAAKKAVLQ